jgi:hypothetical protein
LYFANANPVEAPTISDRVAVMARKIRTVRPWPLGADVVGSFGALGMTSAYRRPAGGYQHAAVAFV